MTRIVPIIFVLIFSMTTGKNCQAQIFDEWAARPNIALKYKINNAWSVTGTYYHYLDDNITHYDKSVTSLDVTHKMNKWLKAGIDYRFGINSKRHYHDIRYSVTADVNLGPKWELAWRPTLQQEFKSLKKESLKKDPVEYYWRNRLTLSFEPTTRWELYFFTENYLEIAQRDLTFYRQKTALGAEFKINERNKVGSRFEVIHRKSGKVSARPDLRYTYTLGRVKKK